MNSSNLILELMILTIALLDTVALLPSHEISSVSTNGCVEGWSVGKRVRGLPFSGLFCFLHTCKFLFVFHQLIYMGNAVSDIIFTDITHLELNASGGCHTGQFPQHTYICRVPICQELLQECGVPW